MPKGVRRKGKTLRDGERRQLARAAGHAGAVPAAASDRACLLCDGGSRGNPGTAASAAVLLGADGAPLGDRAELIGHASAAEAEYRAILLGLALAAAHGADPLEVRSDSRLAIAALEGAPPADAGLAGLVAEIHAAAGAFSAIRWRWHPRRSNEAADALVRGLLWPAAPLTPRGRGVPRLAFGRRTRSNGVTGCRANRQSGPSSRGIASTRWRAGAAWASSSGRRTSPSIAPSR